VLKGRTAALTLMHAAATSSAALLLHLAEAQTAQLSGCGLLDATLSELCCAHAR
jgi:hypothetical protein